MHTGSDPPEFLLGVSMSYIINSRGWGGAGRRSGGGRRGQGNPWTPIKNKKLEAGESSAPIPAPPLIQDPPSSPDSDSRVGQDRVNEFGFSDDDSTANTEYDDGNQQDQQEDAQFINLPPPLPTQEAAAVQEEEEDGERAVHNFLGGEEDIKEEDSQQEAAAAELNGDGVDTTLTLATPARRWRSS
ncbi:hypothetical protein LINGRAHAP2_LOCUS22616 [Linum grandiflorum]